MDNIGFNAPGTGEPVAEKRGGLERVSRVLVLAIALLLPIFFIPSVYVPFQFSKSLLVSGIVLVAFCLWVVARLKDGQFALPQSPLLLSLGSVVGLFVISSLFSGSIASSFAGQGFEVGTTANLFLLALLTVLVPIVFRTKKQIFGSYTVLFVSFCLIAVFQLSRLLFGAEFLSAGILTEAVSNTVGKWNDLGIFFGASALLSLVTIELLSVRRLFRVLIYLTLLVSLFFLAVINFSTVWFVLGLFSLIFLVYLISFGAGGTQSESSEISSGASSSRQIPVPSLIVLLISVIFILAGSTIGGSLATRFKISQLEVRPSWQATLDVTQKTLVSDPLLGSGPNQFLRQWLKFKPAGINETMFWNVDFDYGFGLIPTFMVTSGLLGSLAWVVFFLLFLYSGFKAILSKLSDAFSQYLVTSSFLVSLFLWIFSIFYIPSLTIFTLTFLFTGLFIAVLVSEQLVSVKKISFNRDPRTGFVSVLVLILLLIGGVTLGYMVSQKYLASVYFQKGVTLYNKDGSIDIAEDLIARAAALRPQDTYYRFLSELTLIRMNQLLSEDAAKTSAEEVRGKFQSLLGVALGNARQAVALGPTNYQNLMQLGRVFEAVVPLAIEGSYENAKANYEAARSINPASPVIPLTLARLELAKKDNVKAREYIAEALRAKGNYTEAIFLLSQIEAGEGNTKAAISSAEAASVIAPDDPVIFFQLGMLKFNDKDYRGSAAALERAITLNPAYANAKYFLGLSYEKLGRGADAITQFSDLKTMNPDNVEVDLILRNLKVGRPPFAEAPPPLDDKPEKRAKLPIEEKATTAVKEAE